MLYRELGKTGEQLSILGFGAMRMPTTEDGKIDEAKSIEMIRYCIDKGVNYLDTAYPYHEGDSESLCAKAMKDGYRDKVNIATKSPVWDVNEHADFDKFLDEQLAKLEVEQIDFYLLHALNVELWDKVTKADYKKFLDRAKAEGKIRYAGFSFHDEIGLFKEIIDDYDWDFCQIQLNYMDEQYQAGLEGMKYAAEKGIAVIVMEPLRGGTLSKTELPEPVEKLWNLADTKRTPTQWALRYVWDYPEVTLLLSGMSIMDHVTDNIMTAGEAYPNSLTDKEHQIIDGVKAYYNENMAVNCTGCRYCMPCPVGVDIPEVFWAANHDALFKDEGKAKWWLTGWLKEEARASACIACGACLEHCPQNIAIPDEMKVIADKYETVEK